MLQYDLWSSKNGQFPQCGVKDSSLSETQLAEFTYGNKKLKITNFTDGTNTVCKLN